MTYLLTHASSVSRLGAGAIRCFPKVVLAGIFSVMSLLFVLGTAGVVSAQSLQPMQSTQQGEMLSGQDIVITDALGRTVVLSKPATRVVLARGRYFPILGMVHPDPVSILAGWTDEFKRFYSKEYADYLQKFPDIEDIPIVGSNTAATLSVEKILSLKPDLVIISSRLSGASSGSNGADSGILRMFEAAGVPVIVLDFFVDPLNNTIPSMRALGQALGYPERAEAFVGFYQTRMKRIEEGVATTTKRPDVLMHAHAGVSACCDSPGKEAFNDMIVFAGGHNIGVDVLKGPVGKLSFEYILQRNPSVYIATGTGSNASGLLIGTHVEHEQAVQSLRDMVNRTRLQSTTAVRSANAHGVWHMFNDSPFHLILIELMAKWTHPDVFQDVDPQKTLDEINKQFLPVPLSGTYWVDERRPQ